MPVTHFLNVPIWGWSLAVHPSSSFWQAPLHRALPCGISFPQGQVEISFFVLSWCSAGTSHSLQFNSILSLPILDEAVFWGCSKWDLFFFAFSLSKQFLRHCNLICITSWMGAFVFVSLLSISVGAPVKLKDALKDSPKHSPPTMPFFWELLHI